MDDYHLIQKIGEGSFGRVYRGRRKYTGQISAIKMIPKSELKDDDLISIRREVDILRKVDHPNIMKLQDIIETKTDFCIISELGRGDLFSVINDNQKLPENVMKEIAAQLVSALHYLHQHKIIHRDLKPQNVLVAANGALKLCDFGFARALSRTTLVLNSIKGTPLYMAPELVQHQSYTESIDVWSLGIILYELYYGTPPYFTDTMYKLIKMIIDEPVTWPGPISDDFKSFIISCLQKNPSNRATCEELSNHPFIKGVNLKKYSSSLYAEKNSEFMEALKSVDFSQPTPKTIDVQSVVMCPEKYTENDLQAAMEHLSSITENLDENPLAVAFAGNCELFVLSEKTGEKAVKFSRKLMETESPKIVDKLCRAAQNLIIKCDPQGYNTSFVVSTMVIPFAAARAKGEEPPHVVTIKKDQAGLIRDKICASLFSADTTRVEEIYAIFSYLVQVSEEFLEVVSGVSAAQILPIVTMAAVRAPTPAVLCSALSIICRILKKDLNSFVSVVPLPEFVGALFKALEEEDLTVQRFCVYAEALELVNTALPQLASSSTFQKRVTNVSAHRVPAQLVSYLCRGRADSFMNSLLALGSTSPRTDSELLCYAAMASSPFEVFPVDETMLPLCNEKLPRLLPSHQLPLLSAILRLPTQTIVLALNNMIDIFSIPTCTEAICQFVLDAFTMAPKEIEAKLDKLCGLGMLPAVCRAVSDGGNDSSPAAVLLLAHIVLMFPQPTPTLRELCPDVLSCLFGVPWAEETAFIVAAHFARLSAEFLQPLRNCGAMDYAERALVSDSEFVRHRAAAFLGNVWRHGGLPAEYSSNVIPKLVKLLRDEPSVAAAAAFAIGNAFYHTTDVATYLLNDLDGAIELVGSPHTQASENAALLIANLVRKAELYLPIVLKRGAPEKIAAVCKSGGAMRMLPAIMSLAQYDDGRRALKAAGVAKSLQKLVKSTSDSMSRDLGPLISVLEA